MNIFDVPEFPLTEELTTVLAENDNIRIERIVSTGQVSDWYDQIETEFVILLDGNAILEFENGRSVAMSKGDTLLIASHERHRVSYTSSSPPCVWLCVFYIEGDITMVEPHKIKDISKKYADKNGKFRIFLKNRADPDKLDQQFHDLHNEIFIRDGYDCCKCNNCCKIYDIRIEHTDIPAISEYLELAENEFIEKYLMPDEEETEVFIMKNKPCCFLGTDGKCGIYACRPLVCREFPHTNKPDRLFSMLGMIDFAEDCPVVFEILERLKVIYKFRN